MDETSWINYWKEARKEMPEIMNRFDDILLVIHNSAEMPQLSELLNYLNSSFVYLSLTKTCDVIREQKEKVGYDFFVIDCVSQSLMKKSSDSNCMFAVPPASLDEMTGLVIMAVNTKRPNYIVIDSLSQFIDFSSLNDMSGSMHTFYEKLKELKHSSGCKFVILYDENQLMSLKTLPVYYLKNIMRMEIHRERRSWS